MTSAKPNQTYDEYPESTEQNTAGRSGTAESPGLAQPFPLLVHQHRFRVRYQETDAQGHVHHTNYLNYFEVGRIEMLRAAGHSYRVLEDQGIMLVVAAAHCDYFLPARYDDLLTMTTKVVSSKGVRIRHEYEIHRDQEKIVHGYTVVACVGKDGKVKRLPGWLRLAARAGRCSDGS